MRSLGIAFVAMNAWAWPALGQQGPATLLFSASVDEPIEATASTPVTVVLAASPRLAFRADTRGGDADVLVSHNGLGVTFLIEPSQDLRLTVGLSGELSFYDWGGSEQIFPGGTEPFEDLYSVSLLVAARQTISGPWAIVAGGIGRAQWEEDAEIADGITGGGFVGGGYSFSDSSWVDLGLGVFTSLEDDPFVVPYFNVRLPISERVRFEARGLDAGIVAAVTDDIDFALKGAVEFRDFRLNDRRPAWRDGVVRDLRIPVGGELAWRPIGGLTLALEGGVVVYQEFEFADEEGEEFSDVETEPAAFVGFRIEYRF